MSPGLWQGEPEPRPAPLPLQAAPARQGSGLLGGLFGSGERNASKAQKAQEQQEAEAEAAAAPAKKERRASASDRLAAAKAEPKPKPATEDRAEAKAPPPPRAATVSVWQRLKARVFDLEARLTQQASDTQTQTATVERLREEVDAGRASPAELEREAGVLSAMREGLAASAGELETLYAAARGFLANVLGRSGRGITHEGNAQEGTAGGRPATGGKAAAQRGSGSGTGTGIGTVSDSGSDAAAGSAPVSGARGGRTPSAASVASGAFSVGLVRTQRHPSRVDQRHPSRVDPRCWGAWRAGAPA